MVCCKSGRMTALAGINPILTGFLKFRSAPVYKRRTHMAIDRGGLLRIVFAVLHMTKRTGRGFVICRLQGFRPIPRMLLRFINHTVIGFPVHLIFIVIQARCGRYRSYWVFSPLPRKSRASYGIHRTGSQQCHGM